MLRIKHHEFWNTHLFHLPVYLYWLFLSLKARSLFFFSAANPCIETGGLMGESKYRILQKINSRFVPTTLFYPSPPSVSVIMDEIQSASIQFSFVVKPDIGQGGWMIDLVPDVADLRRFLNTIRIPFMVQEYVEDPLEFGLLYYRIPGSNTGFISSLALKELLTVQGDGRHSIIELLSGIPRATKQTERLKKSKRIDLSRIPANGEKVPLSFVGNHSYGTTFRDASYLVDEQLTHVFDHLCGEIDGFYFGRFDLRCRSVEALKSGDFRILELNGVGSEPLHIFDPSMRLADAYASAFFHWKKIFDISMMNRKKLAPFMNIREAWEA